MNDKYGCPINPVDIDELKQKLITYETHRTFILAKKKQLENDLSKKK